MVNEFKFAIDEIVLIVEPHFNEEEDWYDGVSCYGCPYGIEDAYGKTAKVVDRGRQTEPDGITYNYYVVQGDFDLPYPIEEVFLKKVVAV